ncbi:hypothetical protein ACHAWF_013386 [Thalassiosira exigua]
MSEDAAAVAKAAPPAVDVVVLDDDGDDEDAGGGGAPPSSPSPSARGGRGTKGGCYARFGRYASALARSGRGTKRTAQEPREERTKDRTEAGEEEEEEEEEEEDAGPNEVTPPRRTRRRKGAAPSASASDSPPSSGAGADGEDGAEARAPFKGGDGEDGHASAEEGGPPHPAVHAPDTHATDASASNGEGTEDDADGDRLADRIDDCSSSQGTLPSEDDANVEKRAGGDDGPADGGGIGDADTEDAGEGTGEVPPSTRGAGVVVSDEARGTSEWEEEWCDEASDVEGSDGSSGARASAADEAGQSAGLGEISEKGQGGSYTSDVKSHATNISEGEPNEEAMSEPSKANKELGGREGAEITSALYGILAAALADERGGGDPVRRGDDIDGRKDGHSSSRKEDEELAVGVIDPPDASASDGVGAKSDGECLPDPCVDNDAIDDDPSSRDSASSKVVESVEDRRKGDSAGVSSDERGRKEVQEEPMGDTGISSEERRGEEINEKSRDGGDHVHLYAKDDKAKLSASHFRGSDSHDELRDESREEAVGVGSLDAAAPHAPRTLPRGSPDVHAVSQKDLVDAEDGSNANLSEVKHKSGDAEGAEVTGDSAGTTCDSHSSDDGNGNSCSDLFGPSDDSCSSRSQKSDVGEDGKDTKSSSMEVSEDSTTPMDPPDDDDCSDGNKCTRASDDRDDDDECGDLFPPSEPGSSEAILFGDGDNGNDGNKSTRASDDRDDDDECSDLFPPSEPGSSEASLFGDDDKGNEGNKSTRASNDGEDDDDGSDLFPPSDPGDSDEASLFGDDDKAISPPIIDTYVPHYGDDDESTGSRFSDVSFHDKKVIECVERPKKLPAMGILKKHTDPCQAPKEKYTMPPVERYEHGIYYLGCQWGERMKVTELNLSEGPPKSHIESQGVKYEIMCSKLMTADGKGPVQDGSECCHTSFFVASWLMLLGHLSLPFVFMVFCIVGHNRYRSYYLAVSGNGMEKMKVKSALASIADFETLTYESGAHATVSRLELLVSPAIRPKSNGDYCFYEMDDDEFEVVDDDGHMGCGFIPKQRLVELLKCTVPAQRAFAIQVRIVSPTNVGVAKGMLFVKDGIDRIQIPKSMVKVLKSSSKKPLHEHVALTTKQVFPYEQHETMGRLLNNDLKDPTYSQIGKLKPPYEDAVRVLLCKGVSEDVMDQYLGQFWQQIEYCKQPQNKKKESDLTMEGINEKKAFMQQLRLKHAHFVGVADPTGLIPKGHVFLTGMGCKAPFRVFLTRVRTFLAGFPSRALPLITSMCAPSR